MNNSAIIEDPVFQLNLLLFLTWDAPSTGDIDPVFLRSGYNLSFVETKLTVPDAIHLRLSEGGLHIQRTARPDIFLEHEESHTLVPMECKRSSFSSTSSTAAQARSLLVFDGIQLSTFVGKTSVWESALTYVTVTGNGELLITTLQELSAEIFSYGYGTAKVSCLEIALRNDGVYLSAIERGYHLPNVNFNAARKIINLSEEEDPRPLYIIPFTLGGTHDPDPFCEEVFRERIRLAIALLLGNISQEPQEHTLDTVMERVITVWSMWDHQEEKRAIKSYVRQVLNEVFGSIYRQFNVRCSIRNQTITIPGVTADSIETVRRYINSVAFRRHQIPLSGPLQDTMNL